MLSIEIHSDAKTEDELADMLRHIAGMVEKGYTSNLDIPRFTVSGVESLCGEAQKHFPIGDEEPDDGEVLGVDNDGNVVFWNADNGRAENAGQTPEEYGTEGMTEEELERIK